MKIVCLMIIWQSKQWRGLRGNWRRFQNASTNETKACLLLTFGLILLAFLIVLQFRTLQFFYAVCKIFSITQKFCSIVCWISWWNFSHILYCIIISQIFILLIYFTTIFVWYLDIYIFSEKIFSFPPDIKQIFFPTNLLLLVTSKQTCFSVFWWIGQINIYKSLVDKSFTNVY